MGFRVSIDRNSETLMHRIKTRPASVFDQAYSGYLLFLIGGHDAQILNWLKDNAISLDSLTGSDIAFAIFARRFSVRIRTDGRRDRTPRNVGTVDVSELGDFWKINSLVKSGRFGWVVDGDEITAITYATDEIAKELGVLNDLPCVVILDAIPAGEIQVLRLTPEITDQFLVTLRSTISSFRETNGYDKICDHVRAILEIQDTIDRSRQREAALRRRWEKAQQLVEQLSSELSDFDSSRRSTEILSWKRGFESRLRAARNALLEGSVKQFRRELFGQPEGGFAVLDQETAKEFTTFAHGQKDALAQFRNTIESLQKYADVETWPLRGESLERFEAIVKNHARKLLREQFPSTVPCSPKECDSLILLLRGEQEKLVNTIIDNMPHPDAITAKASSLEMSFLEARLADAKKGLTAAQARLNESQGNVSGHIETLERQLEDRLKAYLDLPNSSFSKILVKTVRAQKLNAHMTMARGKASAFAGGIFKPELLLKIWQLVAE